MKKEEVEPIVQVGEVEALEQIGEVGEVEEDGKGEDEHHKSQDILDPSKLGGGKRLKRAALKTKSPYVVNQQLREQLKNTLPASRFDPFKPVSKEVANAFAIYMETEETEETEPIKYEYESVRKKYFEELVTVNKWLRDEVFTL